MLCPHVMLSPARILPAVTLVWRTDGQSAHTVGKLSLVVAVDWSNGDVVLKPGDLRRWETFDPTLQSELIVQEFVLF